MRILGAIIAGLGFYIPWSYSSASGYDGPLVWQIWVLGAVLAVNGLLIIDEVSRQRQADDDRHAKLALDHGYADGLAIYLRSFDLDGQFMLPDRRNLMFSRIRTSMEALLSDALKLRFPLVGLGGRGDLELGLASAQLVEDWQVKIASAIGSAARILIVPSANVGTLWEIGEIQRQAQFGKTVFIMPRTSSPVRYAEAAQYPLKWRQAQEECQRCYGVTLPDYSKDGLLFVLDDSGFVALSQSFDVRSPRRLALRLARLEHSPARPAQDRPISAPKPSNEEISLHERVSQWRDRARATMGLQDWRDFGLIAILLAPLLSVILIATKLAPMEVAHLFGNVVPGALARTLALMLGVVLGTYLVGAWLARLVARTSAPARALLDVLVIAPLAIPPFLAAQTYGELLQRVPGGATWLLSHHGWIAETLSFLAALIILTSCLYPYAYAASRIAMALDHSNKPPPFDRERSAIGLHWLLRTPPARVSVAGGLGLVAVEVLGDYGVASLLGLNTLTVSLVTAWLHRSSLTMAAAIGLPALVLSLAIGMLSARGERRVASASNARYVPAMPISSHSLSFPMTALIAFAPFLIGFVIPVVVMIVGATSHDGTAPPSRVPRAVAATFVIGIAVAIGALLLAVYLSRSRRLVGDRLSQSMLSLPVIGGLVPGPVLALGTMFLLSNAGHVSDLSWFFLGGPVLVTAYVLRTIWIAVVPAEAVAERRAEDASTRHANVPTWLAIVGLVAAEVARDLPIALLSRPFDFETLATMSYFGRELGAGADAAMGGLVIALLGLVPTVILICAIARADEKRLR